MEGILPGGPAFENTSGSREGQSEPWCLSAPAHIVPSLPTSQNPRSSELKSMMRDALRNQPVAVRDQAENERNTVLNR